MLLYKLVKCNRSVVGCLCADVDAAVWSRWRRRRGEVSLGGVREQRSRDGAGRAGPPVPRSGRGRRAPSDGSPAAAAAVADLVGPRVGAGRRAVAERVAAQSRPADTRQRRGRGHPDQGQADRDPTGTRAPAALQGAPAAEEGRVCGVGDRQGVCVLPQQRRGGGGLHVAPAQRPRGRRHVPHPVHLHVPDLRRQRQVGAHHQVLSVQHRRHDLYP